jgi:hypothetical protein
MCSLHQRGVTKWDQKAHHTLLPFLYQIGPTFQSAPGPRAPLPFVSLKRSNGER